MEAQGSELTSRWAPLSIFWVQNTRNVSVKVISQENWTIGSFVIDIAQLFSHPIHRQIIIKIYTTDVSIHAKSM